MNENYQLILEQIIKSNTEKNVIPKLLLHSCCAPCSSYCIEYLNKYFDITLYFYNPNITNEEEFNKRATELHKLVNSMPLIRPINIITVPYNQQEFFYISKGLEKEPERGRRCKECFYLRLNQTAQYAKNNGFDYFSTTLTISPHKNAKLLNELGKELSSIYNIDYLYSDFKKKN